MASGSASQKRRRERRTYQLDRSSMNRARRRPARSESKASRASVTSVMVACSSEYAQRSSTGRVRGSDAAARPGAQPPALA